MGACSVSVLSVLKKGESQTSHFPFAVLDATLPAGGTGIGFDERRPCLTKSYVLPFVAYLVGVNAISWVGASYPISYAIVVLLVTLLSWHVLRGTGFDSTPLECGTGSACRIVRICFVDWPMRIGMGSKVG